MTMLNVITKLYDAAINQKHWVDTLDTLAPIVGAKSSALLMLETLDRYNYSINKTSSLFSQKMQNEYATKYAQYEQQHFANVAKSEPGSIVIDSDFTNDSSAFYQRPDVKFLREQCGVYQRFAMRLNDDQACFDCITFQYDESRGNITTGELNKLKIAFPHIAKATEVSRTYSALRARYKAVLTVLEARCCCVWIF